MESNSNKPKLGFSGIADLVSDLSALQKTGRKDKQKRAPQAVSSAPRKYDSGSPPVREAQTTPPNPQKLENQGGIEPESSPWNRILGCVGIVVLFVLFINNAGKKNYTPTPSSRPPSQSYSTPQQNQPPSPSSTTTQSAVYYDKPQAGTGNFLSVPQIRWCIREEIRLNTMQTRLNTNSANAAINYFNTLVNDYNARCGDYKYRQGAWEQAYRDVNSEKERITAEAIRQINIRLGG